MHCAVNAVVATEEQQASGSMPGMARITRLALSIGKARAGGCCVGVCAVETQVNFEKLQEQSHRLNQRHREVRALYEQGRALRQQYEAAGNLSAGQWEEWTRLGNSLRELGELLPLNRSDWFLVGLRRVWFGIVNY
eukprot:scaffold13.g293.t1